ncbi:hypothetical protein Taro_002247 [Colocasia esculenta]|uniref:Secreted protein n=1 Tax=Colocasia esculenta TaxID=4460 RepID=A0A843TFX3_COLES|nr:hypothetical protein [Colocasia esculenta]
MLCVPTLADGPFGGFRKGCRACLCLLGLSWLQASCAGFCGGCPASFSFARCSALEGLSSSLSWVWVAEVVEALFRCGPASPSHCLALRWFWSRVGRSQRLVSERGGLCVPLLAACGGGLVVLVVTEFLTLFPMVSTLRVLSGCLVQAPNCCFGNPFLGAVRGGGRACGETVLLTWLLGVSRGDTWLFLPDLVEVRDVGACVSSSASALLEFLLLLLVRDWLSLLSLVHEAHPLLSLGLGHLSTGDSKTEVWIFSSVRSVDSRRPSVDRYALLCKRQKSGYLDCAFVAVDR